MHIEIRSQGFSMTQGLHNYAMDRLQPFLTLIRERARRVRVSLSDQNGPRGGVDKRCLITISLAGARPVVIEDTHADMYSAIDRVSKRALRSVVRRLSRQRHHRGKPSRAEFMEFVNTDEISTHSVQM